MRDIRRVNKIKTGCKNRPSDSPRRPGSSSAGPVSRCRTPRGPLTPQPTGPNVQVGAHVVGSTGPNTKPLGIRSSVLAALLLSSDL